MSVFNLSYAATQNVIATLRKELVKDPLFQPDKTKQTRLAEAIVMDAWGYQGRDFPIVVITSVPGTNRRSGIGDTVRPFHGVALVDDTSVTQTLALRTFVVPLIIIPGTKVKVRHVGENPSDPPGPFEVEVQTKGAPLTPTHFIEITGTDVGIANFPLKEWEANTTNVATGQVFGGWYDLNMELVVGARSTTTRSLVADTIWSLLFFTKKRELAKKGIVVLDMRSNGNTEEPYGADKVYYSKFSLSLTTEFVAIAQFVETVGDVTVEGTATNTL